MRPRRVLVTGVSRFLGGRLAALLAADPAIEAVIGVDTVEPRGDSVFISCTDSDLVARHLLTATEARDVEISSQNLEAAFVALTSDSAAGAGSPS